MGKVQIANGLSSMRIGGLQKTSFIDYPGCISAVIYTQGCNMRCPWCHNRSLVLPEHFTESLSEDEIFAFLEKRRNQLKGLVITGGEPTLQRDLLSFIHRVKDMGYWVKLDTNGSCPEVLESLLTVGEVDFYAMDVKGALSRYQNYTGVEMDPTLIQYSIRLLKDEAPDYELRTTLVPGLHDRRDITELVASVAGSKRFALQLYKGGNSLTRRYEQEELSTDDIDFFQEKLRSVVDFFELRD